MSFQIALTGLNAASTDLQVTSNNIANSNTTGFKSSRAEFADVFSGDAGSIGTGVQLSNVRQEFTQGNVEITQRQLDMAISGNGFFIMNDGGSNLYSRVGAFGLNSDGFVENSVSERLQVYPVLSDGSFNTGALSDLQITSSVNPPVATADIDMSVNLPADAQVPTIGPFDPTNPETYNHSTSTIAYDSLGVAHTTSFFYERTAAGWDVHTTVDGNSVGPGQALTFGADGTLTSPGTGILTLPAYDPGNGANPLNIDLNVSTTTQFGSSFVVNDLNPDGTAEGRLRSIEIDQTGVVTARFSNGQSEPLGKIAVAIFSNPEGLQKASDTSFSETFSSGNALRGEATESNFGLIQSGALESSNVDLTEQLVNMITAQRFFQANAEVISTMDQVTQTVINIR